MMPVHQSNYQPRVYAFPYSYRTFLPLVAMSIAYVCFAIAAFSCDSFKYEDPFDSDFQLEYGYWGAKVPYFGCYSWNKVAEMSDSEKSELLDGPMKTGRAVGVTGAVLGGLTIIVVAFSSFIVLHQGIFIVLGNLVGIFMALFSIALGAGLWMEECYTDDFQYFNCKPTAKGYLAGVAFVFWIIGTSMLCCCMGKPRGVEQRELQPVQSPVHGFPVIKTDQKSVEVSEMEESVKFPYRVQQQYITKNSTTLSGSTQAAGESMTIVDEPQEDAGISDETHGDITASCV